MRDSLGVFSMSQADLEKWNQRYREGAYAEREYPAALLVEHVPEILVRQLKAKTSDEPLRALDIASGAGRNSFYLAGLGYQVDAIDVSAEALSCARATPNNHHARIHWIEHDLDDGFPRDLRPADLIVVSRYLDLDMVRAALQQLRPGGYLLCEVHLATDHVVAGPSGSAFRAAPGELLDAASGLEIVSYWEGVMNDPEQVVVAVAKLVGRVPWHL